MYDPFGQLYPDVGRAPWPNVGRAPWPNVGAEPGVIAPADRIPANTLLLHPCLTREMILSQPRAPGVTTTQLTQAMDAMMNFDNLGCRIEYNTGYRIPEDCRPWNQGETRPLCPGVMLPMTSDGLSRLADFTKAAMPILSAVAPVLGSALVEALAPYIARALDFLGLGGVTKIPEEIKRFVQATAAAIDRAFAQIDARVKEAAKEVFKTLGVSAKTLTDMLQSIVLTGPSSAIAALSYTSGRNGLAVAAEMLRGHIPTIGVIQHLTIGSVRGVTDFASAMVRRDGMKGISALQSSVETVLDQRGEVSSGVIDNLMTNMPSVKGLTVDQIKNVSFPGIGTALSTDLAGKFLGKPDTLLASFDPEKIASLIPNAMTRALFASQASVAKQFDIALSPKIKEAEQLLGRSLDPLQYEIMHPPVSPSSPQRREWERSMRLRLANAFDAANQIVRYGVLSLQPLVNATINQSSTPNWPLEAGAP